jgi:hypothetical protein
MQGSAEDLHSRGRFFGHPNGYGYEIKISQIARNDYEIAQSRVKEAVVGAGHGYIRRDASPGGAVQEGCGYDCANAGVEKGLAEGRELRHEDAVVLHQSRRQEFAGVAAEGTESREGVDARAGGAGEEGGVKKIGQIARAFALSKSERNSEPRMTSFGNE